MNTTEKAAYYSAVLKQNFGVGVPESLDLASVLDKLVEEIAQDRIIIDVLISDKDALNVEIATQRGLLTQARDAIPT